MSRETLPMDFPTKYGLVYPIQKTPGPWIVVGVTCFADHDPSRDECGHIHSVDIHLDDDDPNFEFADPANYPGLSERTIEKYNRPFRRSERLFTRRMTNCSRALQVLDAHFLAKEKIAKYLSEKAEIHQEEENETTTSEVIPET